MKWDLILSAAAVGISIWAILKSYCVDRRQKKYLDIQISEHDQKEEDRKKADLYGEISKTDRTLYLKNQGRATARNITFTVDFDGKGYTIEGNSPYKIKELGPEKHQQWTVHLNDPIKEIPVSFTWDDDYETGRTKKSTIHIN